MRWLLLAPATAIMAIANPTVLLVPFGIYTWITSIGGGFALGFWAGQGFPW